MPSGKMLSKTYVFSFLALASRAVLAQRILPPFALERIRFGNFTAEGSMCPSAESISYVQKQFDPDIPSSDNAVFAMDAATVYAPDRGDCTLTLELYYPSGCTSGLVTLSFTHLLSQSATAYVAIDQALSNGHGTDYTVTLNTPSEDTESIAPTTVLSQATWANNRDGDVIGQYILKLSVSFAEGAPEGSFFILDQIVLAVDNEDWNKDWETCE